MILLTDDEREVLGHWRVGQQPGMDWLAAGPPADRVRAMLVKFMDRYGTENVPVLVLADHLDVDRHAIYAENWPRKAAKLAAEARERGDHPHANSLQAALVSLMYCGACGRPLNDPASITRGIGPDCWPRISPHWRASIERRAAQTQPPKENTMTSSLKASCSPRDAINAVVLLLDDYGVTIATDDISHERAFLSASSLLLALGVEPDIAQDDTSAAADMVRGLLLESATRTTTRSRRSL